MHPLHKNWRTSQARCTPMMKIADSLRLCAPPRTKIGGRLRLCAPAAVSVRIKTHQPFALSQGLPYNSEKERAREERRENERERERASERERDCTAGYANWMAESSVGKKIWCCQNTGKGCAPPVPGCTPPALAPPPLPFDCTAAMPTGWRSDPWARRCGAAKTQARAAP